MRLAQAFPIIAVVARAVAALVLVAGLATSACAYTVVSASRDVRVDCGTGGTDVPTDWYFPQPNDGLGLVWLQHGFSRANNQMADLATRIAERGFVVFAPSMAPGTAGCAQNNAGFLSDFARLFPGMDDPSQALLSSARAAAAAAGIGLVTLPPTVVFSGHSAGGAAAVYVARILTQQHPSTATRLRGLALLDPVESISGSLIGGSLGALGGLPIYTVSSPPYSCNSNANGTALLAALSRPFVGVRLNSGSHCDAEGTSTNFLCTGFCGTSQPENVDILQTLVEQWIVDLHAGGLTADAYPGGSYYDAKLAAGRITTLPSPNVCGNGVVNSGEECDDGNHAPGDCCNPICGLDPAGSACAPDTNPCTWDVCDGATAVCRHPAGNAGTVCRTSTGACDVVERCDGVSTMCPVDTGAADGDGDGACDDQDNCPETPNPSQVNGDDDVLGDACDPCTAPLAFATRTVTARNLDAVSGDDRLTFKGSVTLPAEAIAALDPPARGLRLLLGRAVPVVDATLPPGPYQTATRAGWKRNGGGTKWTYYAAAGVSGIRKATVGVSPRKPGVVSVKITGKDGTFAAFAALPVVTVSFEPPFAAPGRCGEATWAAGGCATPPRAIVCK